MPDQLPAEAVKVCPSTSEPLIVGGELFDGGLVAGCTTAVAVEGTGPAVPELLLPVTAVSMTRSGGSGPCPLPVHGQRAPVMAPKALKSVG